MRSLAFALALTSLTTGCFTVDSASSALLEPDADEHVIVRNYGWNLFGVIPLVCGNADVDSSWGSTFFKDEVTLEIAHGVLSKYVADSGREICDIVVMADRKALWSVQLFVVPISLPWVVQYKEVNVSATLVRKGGTR